MAHPQEDQPAPGVAFHRLSWHDFDAFARLDANASMVGRLRRAERSRRKLLLHALLVAAGKTPELLGPLPPVDAAWELLARIEAAAPSAVDRLLAHPYTGSWAGYTTRLLRNRIAGVCPLWMHLGHVHAVAAAAATRAGLDFEIAIPVWDGNAVLPSLGIARLAAPSVYSVAVVRGMSGRYAVANENSVVHLPDRLDTDAADWWSVQRIRTPNGTVALDDLDPYRGLYEPVPARRLDTADLGTWRTLLDEAWRLIEVSVPGLARVLPLGLDSLVPKPPVLFRNPSASTGEAFGSAVVGRPADGASFAATLIHEFQHIVLGGVLHLIRLYGNDPRERFYVAWRDDPRPIGGALQGVYAFLGVTAFWRALSRSGRDDDPRAEFEFAYWRQQTWYTLGALRRATTLTDAGSRFLDGIAERLGSWQDEPVAKDVAALAAAAASDHRAGWRIRHMRPSSEAVDELVEAWLSGHERPPFVATRTELPATPVPDGSWSPARGDLVRLVLCGKPVHRPDVWSAVPGGTAADVAYVTGHFADAVRGYRAALAADPDQPTSLVGLGLALAASGSHPAARALLNCPELVRAVHRELRRTAHRAPTPERLAAWIGKLVSD